MRKESFMWWMLGICIIILIGKIWADTSAPSPRLETETPNSSNYVVMDRPDDRPVVGISPIGISGDLIVGTDEAIYLYSDHHYVKTLPHMLWEPTFKAGEYIYAVVNQYHRKAMLANRILYRTRDGKNWQRISGKRGTKSTLFAIDAKNDVMFGADKKGDYHSTLYKRDMRTGVVTPLGDKRHRRIENIGWFQGGLYVVCDSGKLYVSNDHGKSFTNITSKLDGNVKGRIRILANEHYLLISSTFHYLHQYDGKQWKEIAVNAVKHDYQSMYMIRHLKDHRLIFSIGLKQYFIMDLRDKKKREIHLPKVYHYPAYAFSGNDLIVSAQLPKDGILRTISGKEADHEKQEKAAQLLKVQLTKESICNRLLGKQRLVKNRLGIPNIIIDSGQIIINTSKELLNLTTNEVVNGNRFSAASQFKQGAVNGDWFIRMIPKGGIDPKEHHYLRQSSDRGKSWKKIDDIAQVGPAAIIDDSLKLAYFISTRSIHRSSIQQGDLHNYGQEVLEDTLESLVVDNTSRVWVQSSEGLFVSKASGGWWQCPLPFRDNQKIAIRGFALLKSYMAVTYRDQLHLSRNDTVNWEPYPIIDPCSKQAVPVRIIGNSNSHIILKDRNNGHLWIVNIETGVVQHCRFEKTNGVAHKAYLSGSTLLIQTTGTPLQRASGEWKGSVYARLLMFNLKNEKL